MTLSPLSGHAGPYSPQANCPIPAMMPSSVPAIVTEPQSRAVDEYDSLRPIADLIRLLQTQISSFLSEPLKWTPSAPPENREAERMQAIDTIRQEVFRRLHDLSTRRLLEERLSGWVEAYDHRGTGSTKVRARDIVNLYESAAPIPNEMPGPDVNEFLFELRELVAESVLANQGELLGWTRAEVES